MIDLTAVTSYLERITLVAWSVEKERSFKATLLVLARKNILYEKDNEKRHKKPQSG